MHLVEFTGCGGDIKERHDPLVSSDSIMATIKARRQANSAVRYTAIVRKRLEWRDNDPAMRTGSYAMRNIRRATKGTTAASNTRRKPGLSWSVSHERAITSLPTFVSTICAMRRPAGYI